MTTVPVISPPSASRTAQAHAQGAEVHRHVRGVDDQHALPVEGRKAKSRRSLMLVESAVRRSRSPISMAIAVSLPAASSASTASATWRGGPLRPALEHNGDCLGRACGPSGVDEDGGVLLGQQAGSGGGLSGRRRSSRAPLRLSRRPR